MKIFVYMVKCIDKAYYVGVTNDLQRRIDEHNDGLNSNSYTYKRRPVELVYFEEFQDNHLAFTWETQLKKWSRKKKEALIESNWSKIKELAECKNESSHKNFKK
ncbi:MAG: GIY-YIG nuclease family protein [Bacteroidia bacterium]